MVDLSATSLGANLTERKLQDEGYAKKDPNRGDGKIYVSDVVNGVVGYVGDGGFDYVVQTDNVISKKQLTHDEGNTRETELGNAAEAIAKSIVEQLCKHKPYRLQGKFNDLVIDALICDLAKPSTFNGKGRTSGLKFTLTPTDEKGGSWVLSGMAGGVPWTGSGTYVRELAA